MTSLYFARTLGLIMLGYSIGSTRHGSMQDTPFIPMWIMFCLWVWRDMFSKRKISR